MWLSFPQKLSASPGLATQQTAMAGALLKQER